jgi:hypothetical protein
MFTAIALLIVLDQHPSMPGGMTHQQHLEQMKRDAETKTRGTIAMGFDQDKTTHNFIATKEGGIISVEVKSPGDTINRDAIRAHLQQIADEFARGVFEKPFATHAEVPAGVPVMQRLRSAIVYRYEQTNNGGRVVITTSDAEALAAVHEFLRYQTREHHTGEPKR